MTAGPRPREKARQFKFLILRSDRITELMKRGQVSTGTAPLNILIFLIGYVVVYLQLMVGCSDHKAYQDLCIKRNT